MTEESKKSKILYILIAGSVVICLLTVFLKKEQEPSRTLGADMVIFGDSLIAYGADTEYFWIAEAIGEELALNVLDCSFGGSTMAYQDRDGKLGAMQDALSMVALTRAIISGDFRVQKNRRSYLPAEEYFPIHLDRVENLDLSQVDTAILEFGINDYHAGIPAVARGDASDEYTYEGALGYVIEHLQEAYPNLRIVLVSPTYSWYIDEEITCEQRDLGYGNLETYVQVQEQVAEKYGLDWIDLYHDLYEHNEFEDWRKVTDDGVHPNYGGKELIVGRIAEYFRENP